MNLNKDYEEFLELLNSNKIEYPMGRKQDLADLKKLEG